MTYDFVFHLSNWRRDMLIQEHLFYVDQASMRLLNQFNNIHQEAEDAAKKWLVENKHEFNPDRHNGMDFLEEAEDFGNNLYMLLDDLFERTILSIVAGMYHEWDKKIREWMVSHDTNYSKLIWNAKLLDIFDLFEKLNYNVKKEGFYSTLDACRLVVNVYKHGQGGSFDNLTKKYPQYLNYTELKITRNHIEEFSSAIVCFWKNMPEFLCDPA